LADRSRLRAAAPLIATMIVLSLVLWLSGRPRRPHPSPLPLESDGVENSASVRDAEGRLVYVNFRTVERGVLYRGAAFPRNAQVTPEGAPPADTPAAFIGEGAFEFLRARNVRTVVVLFEHEDDYFAEEGYFRFWSDRSGYRISVIWVPVAAASAYGRDETGGLHAGAELISLMKERGHDAGAWFVQGESGKDATGIVAAAYETWRNWGWTEPDTLWREVLTRYLASNRTLLDVPELGIEKAPCASRPPSFVCPEWLLPLRPDLERIAQL
jgi:hypothetical protein